MKAIRSARRWTQERNVFFVFTFHCCFIKNHIMAAKFHATFCRSRKTLWNTWFCLCFDDSCEKLAAFWSWIECDLLNLRVFVTRNMTNYILEWLFPCFYVLSEILFLSIKRCNLIFCENFSHFREKGEQSTVVLLNQTRHIFIYENYDE